MFQTKPPKELLTSLDIPNIECIKFYSYDTFSSNSVNQHELFKITNAPIYMEVDNIKSNFVYVSYFILLLVKLNIYIHIYICIEVFHWFIVDVHIH